MLETDNELKEALVAQQFLIQKLYNELDVEREASSSAASEAMSMISRLQGEKAAIKMEAGQYKRLAEENICYAEESIQIFEDIMYQKDMEIASLDYQAQAYRYKLLSLGCNDSGVCELKFPENLLQKNEALIVETSAQSISRRNSAPPAAFRFSYVKNSVEIESSKSPETDMNLRVVEEHINEKLGDQNLGSHKLFHVSGIGNKTSYFEQIRVLDEQVKKIAGEEYGNLKNESMYLPQISQSRATIMLCDDLKEAIANETDQHEHPKTLSENTIHDVFEVSQTFNTINGGDCKVENAGEMILQVSENHEDLKEIPNEAIKLYMKDQANTLNEMLLPKSYMPNVCQPCDGVSIDCHMAFVCPALVFSESQDEQVNISEIVEMRQTSIQEPTNTNIEDGLKFLNEIQEQLKSLEYKMQSSRPKKSSHRDDLSMASLKEAMLHFWL